MNDKISTLESLLNSFYKHNPSNKEIAEIVYQQYIVELEEDCEYWKHEALENDYGEY